MNSGLRRAVGTAFVAAVVSAIVSAGPNRFGFSDRIERHLLPEVTTGPSEPVWSPDGNWIAFSMRGDIWKIPQGGGEAIALTKGPAYHFEPAWSPDGTSIAFSMDTDGNLDIGVVPAAGGEVRRLTEERSVEIEPTWGADSETIYFVGARGRGLDIFKLTVSDRAVSPVVADAGDQLQPAISPDGKTLAYVSPVAGKLGTGGIWTRPLDGGAPTLVHYEESEYRMRPQWTRDGKAFLFGSDERDSNDIAVVPFDGGNPHVITNDPMGEFSPAPSPDGTRFAFVSNRRGPMTLFIAPIGGGPVTSWREVAITRRTAKVSTGRVQARVLSAAGAPAAARIYTIASDGRSYAPDGGFARVMAVTETHYFHTNGTFEVEVPAGKLFLEAVRGFGFVTAGAEVDVRAGATTSVTLQPRQLAAGLEGWYSGDTHAHDLHQGRFGLTHQTLFDQSVAEDLNVTNVLIHMDGTRLMGRWADLTGEPHRLSTRTHLLQFGEEFRGSLGHIGMLGIRNYILPLTGGVNNTAYEQTASDSPYLDGARAQGGIAGFMHPYLTAGKDASGWSGSLIPVDVALGKGDFYDVASLYSDELASAEMYYKLLNCGFRLAATGGTDNFPDVFRDPPPGTDRTYARVDGPLTVASWLAAVKAGRTFATTGPLIDFTVNGLEPGSVLRQPADSMAVAIARVRVTSMMPIDRIEVIVNGKIAHTASINDRPAGMPPRPPRPAANASRSPGGSTSMGTDFPVQLPDGGWIAARVIGPPSKYVGDSYAFAQTTPVYVQRAGRTFVAQDDARVLVDVVDAIWTRADRAPWRSAADRERFKDEIDRARAVYLRLATR